ncbi:GntR family transcriptional regulator [Amphibacillus sp. Q70]|uniref:GntR family transcriptional regulator n=1 Tax=Amphibacillus sp. Q70 TaxID=3453416 RepID=UPI003F8626FF
MDKTNKIPLYLQLMDKIVAQINRGDYVEHDKLPSERELCEIYNLSRITVRQALQELEREGYIYREHGKGTFVAPKSFDQPLVNLYSFTEEMKRAGKKPTTKVLSFEKMVVDERLAAKMTLNVYDEVFKVTRLRLANDEPLMYETSFLPLKVFPGLTEETLTMKPMYNVFLEHYGVRVTRATERFSATTVRHDEAQHLKILENQPAMLVKRYAYDRDTLIEYTISVARGDKFNYTVELS